MKKSPTDYDIPARVSLTEIRSTTKDMAADRKVIVSEIKFLVGILKAHHKEMAAGSALANQSLAQVKSLTLTTSFEGLDEYILEDE